jgi:hypothetical protein
MVRSRARGGNSTHLISGGGIVGTQRQSWTNPHGKLVSLVALAAAALFAAFCAVSASGVVAWTTGPEQETVRWVGTAVLAVISLACVGLALLPTWGITAGPRGVGLKKLWRHRFIPHDNLREVRLDGDPEAPKLRFVTEGGTTGVMPRIAGADEIAKHVNYLKRRRD